MTELQQHETIKSRLSHLKTYIHSIKQQMQMIQKPKNILFYSQISCLPQMIITSSLNNGNKKQSNQLLQIERLQHRIKQKVDFIMSSKNKTQKLLKNQHRSIPFSLRIYQAKFNLLHSFHEMIKLLSEDDWEDSGIFIGQMCFIVISSTYLLVTKIKFTQILIKTIQIMQNYLKFKVQSQNLSSTPTMIILQFKNHNDAIFWHNFIINLCETRKYEKNPKMKWLNTKVECKQTQILDHSLNTNIDKHQKRNYASNTNNNFMKLQNLLKPQNLVKTDKNINKSYRKYSANTNSVINTKKVSAKQSLKSSSFFLSNSSDRNITTNFQINAIKIKEQDQLTQSIKFQDLSLEKSKMLEQSKNRLKQFENQLKQDNKKNSHQMKSIISVPNIAGSLHSSLFETTLKNEQSPRIRKQVQLLMTNKVMTKLQQKRKLLADSSLTKLSIHWHDDTEQKNSYHHHQESESPEKQQQFQNSKQIRLFKKKQSLSLKKNSQPYTRRDSNDSPNRFMRVQSATNDKSYDDNSSLIQERNRKKTDFSLQHDKHDLSSERKKSKNQIRDQYMNKLVQKETIREMSRSSSNKDDSSSRKELGNLIPIPEKLFSRAMLQPSIRSRGNTNQTQENSYYQTQTSKQSTEQQIQVQQLKNGIVLQKCSKNAWKAKQKKLYLSNTMAQICYCDIQNPLEQKRFFLKDIKSIEYGKVSRGILKHKKRYDQSRCLLIRVYRDGKQKILQFYLQDSQPVYNLQQFTKKLQSFIQKQSQQQQQNYDN